MICSLSRDNLPLSRIASFLKRDNMIRLYSLSTALSLQETNILPGMFPSTSRTTRTISLCLSINSPKIPLTTKPAKHCVSLPTFFVLSHEITSTSIYTFLGLPPMSQDFKVPHPPSTQPPRKPKKRIHGLHNIRDTTAIARFCLAMDYVLQHSGGDSSSESDDSSDSLNNPAVIPWTGGRTGVTLTLPSLSLNKSELPPSQFIEESESSSLTSTPETSSSHPSAKIADDSTSSHEQIDHLLRASRQTHGPKDLWLGANSTMEQDSALQTDSSSSRTPPRGPATSTPVKFSPAIGPPPVLPPRSPLFPDTAVPPEIQPQSPVPPPTQSSDDLLMQAAEDYDAAAYLISRNFDSESLEQSLFVDNFFETDPYWTQATTHRPKQSVPDEQPEILRGNGDRTPELEDSVARNLSAAHTTGNDIMSQAMASIQEPLLPPTTPDASRDSRPPSPDLTEESMAVDDSPPLNTSKKRLHSALDDEGDTPKSQDKSRRLSDLDNTPTPGDKPGTPSPKTQGQAHSNRRPRPSRRTSSPPRSRQSDPVGQQSGKPDKSDPFPRQSPLRDPKQAGGPSTRRRRPPGTSASPGVSPIRGEKSKPPPTDDPESSVTTSQNLDKSLIDFIPDDTQQGDTSGNFQVEISNLVTQVRSNVLKVGASLNASLLPSDPKVTVYGDDTKFSAEDLLPPVEAPIEGDTISFPELQNQVGAKVVTLKKEGPVYFLLVARTPEAKRWSIPTVDHFLDYMNLIQSALLHDDPPFADSLAWFNPWGSHNMGLVGIHPDQLDHFSQLRQYIASKLYDGQVYNTYPKELIAKRYEFTAMLKKNLRTFNLRVLPKAIFKKNKNLDIKGDLVLLKSKEFGRKEVSKQGEPKGDWRLALLSGSESFMQSVRHLPNSHPFNVGSASIQLRGGDRRREDRKKDSRSTQPREHHFHDQQEGPTRRDDRRGRRDLPREENRDRRRGEQYSPIPRHDQRSPSSRRETSSHSAPRPLPRTSGASSTSTPPSMTLDTRFKKSAPTPPATLPPSRDSSPRRRRDPPRGSSTAKEDTHRPHLRPGPDSLLSKTRKTYVKSAFLSSGESDMEQDPAPVPKEAATPTLPPASRSGSNSRRTVKLVDRPIAALNDDSAPISSASLRKTMKSSNKKKSSSAFNRFYEKK